MTSMDSGSFIDDCPSLPLLNTLEGLIAIAPDIGVTRLADITGLDVVGIPVWQAVRPLSRNFSVSQGKGACPHSAQVSALMEALEMYCAENPRIDWMSSISAVRGSLNYDLLELPGIVGHLPQNSIGWISAHFLDDMSPTMIPHALVSLDFTRTGLEPHWVLPTSTGFGGGRNVADAATHALYEIVERASTRETSHTCPKIEFGELPADEPASGLIDALLSAGIDVALYDSTGSLGIPCATAKLFAKGVETVAYGTGCASDRSGAIEKALLEAVQSRLTMIAGAREDITNADYPMMGNVTSSHYSRQTHRAQLCRCVQSAAEGLKLRFGPGELRGLVEGLGRFRLRPIGTKIFGREGLTVCRVLVPGLPGPV